MATLLLGGCLCGAVRYQVKAGAETGLDPNSIPATYCHCSMCRKATGGGFATLLAISRDAVTWMRGAPSTYRSSPVATRGFCDRCGSPLFYDGDSEATLAITVGSLDDAAGVRPDHHYGIESRLPWVDCGPDLPGRVTAEQFEGQD